jgi:hypothetical protein
MSVTVLSAVLSWAGARLEHTLPSDAVRHRCAACQSRFVGLAACLRASARGAMYSSATTIRPP